MSRTPDEAEHRQTVVYLAILVEGGLIFLAWVLGWMLGQPPLLHFGWSGRDTLIALAGTLPLVLLFLAMVRWPVGPLASVKQFTHEILAPMLAPCTLVDLAGISLLAGLGEEMVFRGVLQGAFTRWIDPLWGLAIASMLFGLLHAVTPAYAVLATVMGAYLGATWIWTGNLLVPIVIHGVYDFLALLYLVRGPERPRPPAEPPAAEGDFPPGEP